MDDLTQGAQSLAKIIDHTLLKPSATYLDFTRHCEEAAEHNFFSVCVPPHMVGVCKKNLKLSPVKICTVVGFPNGYNLASVKIFETKTALDHGADEIDMVLNISALKSGALAATEEEIREVVRSAGGKTVKVILENCFLTRDEKITAIEMCINAGAHFIKTSTGFGTGGATIEDIKLMSAVAQGRIQIKASGGIRDTATALAMCAAGATRLGTSNSIQIVTNHKTLSVSEY